MITWLILIVLVGFGIHLYLRLQRLEERLEEVEHGAIYAPAPESPPTLVAEPEPIASSLPERPKAPEPRRPAVVLHAEARPQARVSEPLEEPDLEQKPERRSWKLSIGFEELFGRRLPIWAGGITLAVAGMLIVKLSIESGLVTPPIRVVSGLLFGAALIGGAELALRFEERVRDPRVRQALAGAGIASLYASILIAVNLYHLISPLTAMLGMAGVTALAMFLATRFGAPSALLGLAGGLAAPALIGSNEPNVPLLSVYLALAVAGLCTLSRNQRWAWLGISALVGGFGWGIILLIGGVLDTPSSISLGLYLLLLGVGIPALGFAGDHKQKLQLIAGIVAAAQMAALVATGGFALTNWGLFGLLAIASIWLARRDEALAKLPAIGLLVALLLLGAWPSPTVRDFALVLIGAALIYSTPAILQLWKAGGLIEAAQVGALGLGGLLLPMLHFHRSDGANDVRFGLLALGLSAGVGACAALGWRNADRGKDARFALLGTVTAVLLAGAALLLLPIWMAGVAIGVIGLGLLHLGQVAADRRFEPMAWIFAAAGALAYPYSQTVDWTNYPDAIRALHWTLQSVVTALFAWRARLKIGRGIAQFLTPAFLCAAVAFLVHERIAIVPLIAPVLLVATAGFGRRLDERLIPAMASSLLIIVAWALEPLFGWGTAGAVSLAGSPMLVTDVPQIEPAITQLLVPGFSVAAAIVIAMGLLRWSERTAGWTIAALLAAVGAHSLFKHVFAIATPEKFVSLGLAERTVWEVALAALAALAFRFGWRWFALALAGAAAAHEAFYTLLLHNPLWAEQAVGPWPVVNLILPAYALAFGLVIAAKRIIPDLSDGVRRGLGIAQMVLIGLFAFSELRQLFHGTLLVSPGLPMAEDILRSILAIGIAIGFLLWGIAHKQRDWRIASLALMLGAVGKVFLFDASGLEGVTRIASFVALGFSLIGIGWLYSRYLGSDCVTAAEPA
jgi:uncharacterized membrane protein